MLPKPPACAACILGKPPIGSMEGYVPADGTGDSGVLIILEAAGVDEAAKGVPTIGKAGYYFWSIMKRAGLSRPGFRIHNVLSCRPPDNKLDKAPWRDEAIAHCSPNLDRTINMHRVHCRRVGKTPTILALGKIAARRVLRMDDNHPVIKGKHQLYPHWSHHYQCWVVAGDHPAFLVRGKRNLEPRLVYAAQQAVRIASTPGYALEKPDHICDPPPEVFGRLVDECITAFENGAIAAHDIETPMKERLSDEDAVAKEDDLDYRILRDAIAWGKDGEVRCVVSAPWDASFLPHWRRFYAAEGTKWGWNSDAYDNPRIQAQVPLGGLYLDGMLAWHVLKSGLPKGLGDVVPYFCPDHPMWKHWAGDQPALYNAIDADVTLRCVFGIVSGLNTNGLWKVYKRHVYDLNKPLAHMRDRGVLKDMGARQAAEDKVTRLLEEADAEVQAAVPLEVKPKKVYKRKPEGVEGLVEIPAKVTAKWCPNCGEHHVLAAHFKSIGKKRLKAGEAENPCAGLKAEKVEIEGVHYGLPQEFKISNTSLQRYQSHLGHKPVMHPKEKRPTFDAKAVKRLSKRYPDDPLYRIITTYNQRAKLLGTYIGRTQLDGTIRGGMPTDRHHRVHTLFTHNPSTLRLASQNPNLQNLPRPNPRDPEDLVNLIRGMIVPAPGNILAAVDYSGIEAVLVGWEARDPGYIRLALRDVHSFYTAYGLHALDPKKVTANDLPLLSWSDEKLFTRLAEIKREFKWDRNTLFKHLVHGANFGQQAKGTCEKIEKETGERSEFRTVKKLLELYREELFPSIPRWQTEIQQQADRQGWLRNAFGYIHDFRGVIEREWSHGYWNSKAGPDAFAVLAFRPQSNGGAILKEATLRLWENHYEEAGQFLRLLIHDEIWGEVPRAHLERFLEIVMLEMGKPVPELPLDPEWGLGDYLAIECESKVGERWSEME